MWKPVRSERSRYLAGFLGVCCLPLTGWGFFPPIDLYPPPVSLPPALVVEQPVPPVPVDPIVPPAVLPPTPLPIISPPADPPEPPAQVPEPTTLALALLGLGGVYGIRRKRG